MLHTWFIILIKTKASSPLRFMVYARYSVDDIMSEIQLENSSGLISISLSSGICNIRMTTFSPWFFTAWTRIWMDAEWEEWENVCNKLGSASNSFFSYITTIPHQTCPEQLQHLRRLFAPSSAYRRLGNLYCCKGHLDVEILDTAGTVSTAAWIVPAVRIHLKPDDVHEKYSMEW